MTSYVISIGLAVVFGALTLWSVVNGTAGGVAFMAVLTALCAWSAYASNPERKKLEAEHARLTAEKEARR